MARKHCVRVTFSDSNNDEATLILWMDDDMRDAWLDAPNDTLAALGVERLAYVLEPGEANPYVFRKVWTDPEDRDAERESAHESYLDSIVSGTY